MSKVILTVGIPASGKSTWAIAEAKKTGAMIVCRDDIRKMLGLGWNEDENKVTKVAYCLIKGLLESGHDFIVADTSINKRNREIMIKYIMLCSKQLASVELKFFPISITEACRRDDLREARVGPSVIFNMQRHYIEQFGRAGTE